MPPNTRGIQPLPSHPSSRMLEEERKESGEKKQRLHNQWSLSWPGQNDQKKAELIPTLSTTDNRILLTHQLGTRNKSQPPFKESQRIARAEGKCSRHKGCWREGKDQMATHSMTTEVWINTRGQIPEATRMAIQEALEEDNTKDTPSFGTEDLDDI